MVVRKYSAQFYIFSLFISLLSNSFLKYKAEEIDRFDKFSTISKDKIIWKDYKVKEENIKNNKIKWKKYNPEPLYKKSKDDFLEKIIEKNYEEENKNITSNEFFYLGLAVPNAEVMDEKDFMIYADQLFPFYKSDLEQGATNQNYSVFLSYGMSEHVTLMGFFSHSDDPLYSKIYNVEIQPANKWISTGIGSRINIINKNKLLTSLDTSIESWYVKSGGCNGIGCNSNSSNIFDKSINVFENFNLVGSISLPTSYQVSKKTNIVFSPRLTFLPEEQTENTNSGSFYGFNSGLGIGLSHELTKKFHIYNSTYIPLSGKNYFDQNLTFKKAIIYNFGFSYILDPKISFQSYLTNSFGSTPATGILTIPSENNLIFGTRLIYKPTSLDFKENSYNKTKYRFDGLSVTNSNILKPKERLVDILIDKDSGIWTTITTGISRSFNFEITTGKSGKKSKIKNDYFNEYIDSNLQTLRFGGKAILINQNDYLPITSGVRMTFGRTLGEKWPGYLFLENTNTINLSKRLNFNLTPKFAWTGAGNPIALGSSLILDINNYYSIILERNTSLKDAESNLTTALRISNDKRSYFDLYVTDAANFTDIGELINAKEISYGLKLGFKF